MAEHVLDVLTRDSKSLIKAPSPGYIFEAKRAIYHNHACIATEIGNFSLSLDYFQKEMTVYEDAINAGIEFPGGSNALTVILSGIANSYQGQGDQDAAEVYYRKCLESRKNPDRVHSSYEVNICRSQWARGANDEASSGLEELLKLREERYGHDDTKDFV